MEDNKAEADQAPVIPRGGWPLEAKNLSNDETSSDLTVGTTVLKLLDLPTEIIATIFESLVPAPLPTGTGLPLAEDILASRGALFNLCLTSQVCREIALPLMHRNVIITSRMQMVNLLVNLATHENRCQWIRSLAVPTDLIFENISRIENRAILGRLGRLLEANQIWNQAEILAEAVDKARALIHCLDDFLDDDWLHCWLYKLLLRILLYLGVRIEDLLITAPDFGHLQRLWDCRQLRKIDMDSIPFILLPHASENQARMGDAFKALRRIRTQSETGKSSRFEPLPVTLEFLKCQQWEFLHDNGNWWSLWPYKYYGYPSALQLIKLFPHVTDLRLYHSRTHPVWLRYCLHHAKHLEKFTYTTRATEWNYEFADDVLAAGGTDATLQQALDEVKGTLTELRLGWVPSGAELTEEDRVAIAPHRVDVSGFPRLKRVEIDGPFLFPEGQDEGNSNGGDDDTE